MESEKFVIFVENPSLKQKLYHKQMNSGTHVFTIGTKDAMKFDSEQDAMAYMDENKLSERYKAEKLWASRK